MRKWIGRIVILGSAALILSASRHVVSQDQNAPPSRQSQDFTVDGAAVEMLVTRQLSPGEIRKLKTSSRTARDHPDLAEYYRNEARRLYIESVRYERYANAAGDTNPLRSPNHFGISRTARFDISLRREKMCRLAKTAYWPRFMLKRRGRRAASLAIASMARGEK
jgi:hypothetical protein